MNYKKDYSDYIFTSNIKGSGKASSYVRALDLLSELLKVKPFNYSDCIKIWYVSDLVRLNSLYEFTKNQKRKGVSSEWNIEGFPKSYFLKGYYSAALASYIEFHSSK